MLESIAQRRYAAFFVACVLALSLGACKREANQVPELQGANAPIDVSGKIKGFGLVSAGRDEQDDEAALVLEFSQPLANAQAFDQLLVVKGPKDAVVKGSWVLSDDGKKLRFPYIESSQTYTVLIRAGLAAADGKTLGKDEQRKIFTGPLEPAVGFASQGSVLPARESRGLPVVSVNVPEVDVEFYRVRDSEVAKFFAEYQRGGRRSGWQLDQGDYDSGNTPLRKYAESVYVNRFVLGGAQNERRLTHLPVQDIAELQKPGLYFAAMKQVGRFDSEYETAIFYVSDIGLHLRAYKDRIYVHTASLKTGEALGDVALTVIDRKGETVMKAATDGGGDALVAYKLNAEQVLVARRGNDVSMLAFNQPALDLSEFAVAGREQAWFDVFAWSGRDLYRPGETVRLSALMRDQDGKPVKAQPLFLSLKQPDGKVFLETQLSPREGGFYEWQQALSPDVPTGRWQVQFRTAPGAGDVVQGMTLRIEEFLPERMKLDLDSSQKTLKPGEALQLDVSAAYLYGAPASGNRFTARLGLIAEQHPVEKYPDHYFGDPTVTLPKKTDDIVDSELDEQGKLKTPIELPAEVKGGAPVSAIVTGSVYETGGRPVSRSLKRTMWPAATLVGLRPLFDAKESAPYNSTVGFEVLRSDVSGKLSAANNLSVSLLREQREYHWTYESGHWGYDYNSSWKTIDTKTVAARAEGGTRFDFTVEWGDYRVEVRDPATGLVTRFPFVAGWSEDNQNRGLDARPDKVKLALDKTAYRAGDKLKVTLTPPHAGAGVLLVETDRLLHAQPIEAKPGSVYELNITKDWERHDVYITALVFRGGSSMEKITPARAVGVAHVPMDRRERTVAVTVTAPKMTKPEQPLPITVKAPQLAGKKAWVTVSAVDVGILNITRFPVPDASKHFFAQRRLGVDAYDIYGRVIESFEGDVARLKFGGDMAVQALPQARRPTARVQTVDLYSGAVVLDKQGAAQIKLDVPDFNGTLRVSALVYSDDKYGQGSSESVLRAPILAEISAPRALAPGDRSMLTLDVQNFTGKAGEFTVDLDASGPIEIAGERRKLSLGVEKKSTLSFPIAGGQGIGLATVKLKVSGGGQTVNRSFDVPVRPAWSSIARSRLIELAPGQPLNLGADAANGLLPGSVNARVTLSSMPPIPFGQVLDELLKYPYGCAEQTTTRGYAALLLDADTARRMGFAGLTPDERRKRLEGAFTRLSSMQTSSGHFSFWGGDSEAYPVLTPYIAEFLLESREAGFAVPESMLQKALERLNEDLLTGSAPFYGYSNRDHLRFAYQAQAGYVLARLNRAPLGTLRALYDNERSKAKTPLALMYLGLALNLQGDQARGKKAIAEAFAKKDEREGYWGDYGSSLRDQSLMLMLARKHKLKVPQADARLLAISKQIAAEEGGTYRWYSTQEQIALARLAKTMMADIDPANAIADDVEVAGNKSAISSERVHSRLYDYRDLAAGLRYDLRSTGKLYATVDVAGIPRARPAVKSDQMSVVRRYFNTDGTPWKGGTLKEGQALIVQLEVESKARMPDALLVDLLPAGLEIENLNLTPAEQWADISVDGVSLDERGSQANIVHEEYRDDRYVAALKLEYGTAKLYYLARAVTPGTYTVPPPQLEDMYRPDLRAIGKVNPETITVVQP
ncbi:alpha-2-macroglobulin family protein [Arenimonas sp.]|uniref:alpha-2-macroglobulin family protein n=1 Tax=Arenimonas sp. TaxID=1872635 RepID=UPI0039E4C42F